MRSGIEAIPTKHDLINARQFWGLMVTHGSRVARHTGSLESAMDILSPVLRPRNRIVLRIPIQPQIVEVGRSLEEMAASAVPRKDIKGDPTRKHQPGDHLLLDPD
jgi:hypothetical protein